ncbi:maleylacetoacetate isomerase [Maritimibacter sp. UBA3975]|uniref:maleylacetoacetate isomerase n=1 Tax=Maritimibacter sp. UBA3975 TaxID=1946833 RepID=UPI000C0B9233|nr:maleylacetoacetate isomerase [Maritimibacter sp. UBA3975]MAM59914.1 maleylacetoacetate isomerase [Maritimibacter sp.]|tara:strand:+ start:10382 stop:11011 length:630 start_codon:yes stop_codon:yes gene_type:complete
MKLYTYWRSTTSYRVRIALNLKGIGYEPVPVNLVAGEQRASDYAKVNPGLGVPTLVTDEGVTLTQSMAILEWLEETHPEPALLPADPAERAHVRAAALGIATDIHPVNNLRVVGQLKTMGHSPDDTVDWMNHWMSEGFAAFQSLIRPDTPFAFGDAPGLADICLVPQLYNARRWGTDLTPFTRLTEIEAACLAHPAFDAARPEAQPDAT